MDLINYKLYIICFLDAVCIGLILPILATHIFVLGGTHTLTGILAAGHTIFQLVSRPLTQTWRDKFGKKRVLQFTLLINFATYLPLGITGSYYHVILLRYLFALTNQTQTLCKGFIPEYNPKETCDRIYNVTNALTVAGLVVGPIVSGQMYEHSDGFYNVTVLASFMILLCLLTTLTLPSSTTTNENNESLVQTIKEDFNNSLNNLRNVNICEQWDIVLLKYLYHTCITVYFIKFSLLLRVHYEANASIIGYTYAYQSILTFLAHFVISIFKKNTTDLVPTLMVAAISFMGLCYASTYDVYLLFFIPMILAHTLMLQNWKNLFKLRSTVEHNIENVEETVAKVVSIVTPVIFGIFCDLYGHYALKAFVIIPLLLDIFIAIVYSSNNASVLIHHKDE